MDWLIKILTDAGIEVTDAVKQALEAAAPDNIVAKKDYDDLQAKYDTDTATLNKTIADNKLAAATDLALLQAGARNLRAVKGLLEQDKLKLAEDGSIEGLTEQLAAVKKSDGYMFASADQTPPPAAGKEPPAGDNPPPAAPATMSEAVAEALAAQQK